MRRNQRSVVKNLTLYDRSNPLISPPSQPLTSRNQTPGVVRLFGCARAIVHDAHGQRCHRSVDLG